MRRIYVWAAAAVAGLLLGGAADGQTVYISEFMAANKGTLFDEEGDAPDWIEIHNASSEAVNLEGYALTDDPANAAKWIFPSVDLPGGAYLVVHASGKDRRGPEVPLHTNFSLDNKGEYLALFPAEGVEPLSEWHFSEQQDDVAFGWPGSEVTETLISAQASCRWEIPSSTTSIEWQSPDFDDALWQNGVTGLGTDRTGEFQAFIFTDLAFFSRFFPACYVRVPFDFSAESGKALTFRLRVRYEDGFIAYLNGERLASANAPSVPTANSLATSGRTASEAVEEEVFEFEADGFSLREGTNVLAIHVLNSSSRSSDLLIAPRLEMDRRLSQTRAGYLTEPTPGSANGVAYEGFVGEVKAGVARGFHAEPFRLALSCETPGAEIRYTLDASEPTPTHGLRYEEPIEIAETSIVRARAFAPGLVPSPVATHSYLFPDDIIRQEGMRASIVDGGPEDLRSVLRTALPTVSLVTEIEGFFGAAGIYTRPELDREVPVSIEYLFGTGFQTDAGVSIHGGNARTHPKKPLRLNFRRKYGVPRLNYPLFEGSPVSSFDQLILRAGGHDSWSIASSFGTSRYDLPYHASYLRDQFLRRTETEMGRLSPRGRYVQLYINGRYWGVYDLHERPNDAFFSDHMGGMESEWDVLHHPELSGQSWVVLHGNADAWQSLHDQVNEGIRSSEDYAEIRSSLDIEAYIDSLIVRMWSGDYDWIGPVYLNGDDVTYFTNKNWYAARRQGEGNPFYFFAWDAEMSMGSHLLINLTRRDEPQRELGFDLTRVGESDTPTAFHDVLRSLPDYRRTFGDRVQRHLFGAGALSLQAAQDRLQDMMNTLDGPMLGESARWGHESSSAVYARDTHWRSEVEWLRDTFIPERHAILLDQLQVQSLFPPVKAPEWNPPGGALAGLGPIALESAGAGTVYVTTDGSDPATRPAFSTVALVEDGSVGAVLVPSDENGGSALGLAWSALEEPENAAAWVHGPAPFGYDAGDQTYDSLIRTQVESMRGLVGSVFIRIPFHVPTEEDIARLQTLQLWMRYDDGFVAYVNGVEVARKNAPSSLSWTSQATQSHFDDSALRAELFDCSAALDHLHVGMNVLAIQGLNSTLASSDLLIAPRLEGIMTESAVAPSATARVYDGPIVLGESTLLKARLLDDTGRWSALSEAFFWSGARPTAENLVITEIHYHPQVSPEAEALGRDSSDFEFVELRNIGDEVLQLAGMAFVEGIDFTFNRYSLAPGERVVIVHSLDAFVSRYGDDARFYVAGEYGGTSRLSNGGETLTLVSAEGVVVQQVRYEDGGLWPGRADGGGFSLVLRDENRPPMAGDPAAWMLSLDPGGTPGTASLDGYAAWRRSHFEGAEEDLGDPEADPDGDAVTNLLEYVFASDPWRSDDLPAYRMTVDERSGEAALWIRSRANLDDITIAVERLSEAGVALWTTMIPLDDSVETFDLAPGLQIRRYLIERGEKNEEFYRLEATLE